MLQVEYINACIHAAGPDPPGPLYRLPLVEDPCDKLIEVHLTALKWNMQQCRFGLMAEGCDRPPQLSVELLELLKSNMPNKTGQSSRWKIEKADSILWAFAVGLFRCMIFFQVRAFSGAWVYTRAYIMVYTMICI
jgi:hypothetical protein